MSTTSNFDAHWTIYEYYFIRNLRFALGKTEIYLPSLIKFNIVGSFDHHQPVALRVNTVS
jgi:hypothetical protein